jgi:hypothetical protein
MPWQLRPAAAPNILRLDTSIDSFQDAPSGERGTTIASLLFAGYRMTESLIAFARLAVAGLHTADTSAQIFGNPAFGGSYFVALPHGFRLAFLVAMAIPVGDRDRLAIAVGRAAQSARAVMDNAMFALNDVAFFTGVDAAWVGHNLTVQVEATVFELVRAQGQAIQAEYAKTNFTTGLFIGYFPLRWASVGIELRYQRWLSPPRSLAADGSAIDNLTLAGGVRFHARAGRTWLRPGIAYSRALDNPLLATDHNLLQIDLPVFF